MISASAKVWKTLTSAFRTWIYILKSLSATLPSLTVTEGTSAPSFYETISTWALSSLSWENRHRILVLVSQLWIWTVTLYWTRRISPWPCVIRSTKPLKTPIACIRLNLVNWQSSADQLPSFVWSSDSSWSVPTWAMPGLSWAATGSTWSYRRIIKRVARTSKSGSKVKVATSFSVEFSGVWPWQEPLATLNVNRSLWRMKRRKRRSCETSCSASLRSA